MIKLILVMLLAAVSNSAMAEWEQISATDDGPQDNYVDRNSIQKNKHIVKMWSLVDFRKLQKLDESSSPMFYQSIAKRFDYDCKKNQYRMTAYNYYSDKSGEGNTVIGDSNLDNPDWQKVEPGSFQVVLWKIACGKM
ncbi:MAG: surface-adhesin E family protein [Gallionella sp.]